jgi:hypothetical protein
MDDSPNRVMQNICKHVKLKRVRHAILRLFKQFQNTKSGSLFRALCALQASGIYIVLLYCALLLETLASLAGVVGMNELTEWRGKLS